jgi:hypothetical protein
MSGKGLLAEIEDFFGVRLCFWADVGKGWFSSSCVLTRVDFILVERRFLGDGVEFRWNQLPVLAKGDLRTTTISVGRF